MTRGDLFGSRYENYRTWAEIDLDAAQSNYKALRARANGKMICAVVKADAYGHGAARLARLYEELGADYLAVSNFAEACELRRSGISLPILVLGYVSPMCAASAYKYNITLTLYSLPFAEALSKCAAECGATVGVHLKFDTGMGRIGFFPKESGENSLPDAYRAATLPGIEVCGAFTHFASADGGTSDADEQYTRRQFALFLSSCDYMRDRGIDLPLCHCSNSAAFLDYPDLSCQMVRLGISLYGLSPSAYIRNPLSLKPVMTLKSIISSMKILHKGEALGYGRAFVAVRDTVVATVPVGYADGVFRSASDGGAVLTVLGKPARILGRVCMDQLMTDVTDIGASVFDGVSIYGAALESADSFAARCGTVGYECVCAVGRRVPRIYLKNGALESSVCYL